MRPLAVDCKLSSSSNCPDNCRICKYGGNIAIQWIEYNLLGRIGYVKYFTDKESVLHEYIETDQRYRSYPITPQTSYIANNTVLKKLNALITWLNENYKGWTERLKEVRP